LGFGRYKSKIIGFLLVLIFLVSAYTLIVQAVQEFNNMSLITQLSLFGSNDAYGNETQFNLGETLSVCACVSAGNVYSATIYGANGSVFSQTGWINGSMAVVRVPLDPPAFHANQSYVVALSVSISVYPIPGAYVTDQKMAAFAVLAPATQLNITCNYDDTMHRLSLSAALATSQGTPVANKTIAFSLQLNTSSYVQDRGWLPLGSATTDANGLASYVTGCDIISGIQYVKAEFAGDSDYSGSTNTTQFTVTPFSPVIQSVNVTSTTEGTEYAINVTDPNGYPLMGKTVAVQGQQSADPAYGMTDSKGTALVWLNGSDPVSGALQNVTVLSDVFSSQAELPCNSSGYAAPSSDKVIHLSSDAQQTSQGSDGLTVSLSPTQPCAVLPTLVTASYCGYITPGGLACFTFLLDGVRELSQVYVVGMGNSTYNVPLEWCSDVTGNQSIMVTVSTLSVPDAVLAEDSVAVDPDRCPDNLQLNTPQVIHGDQIELSLVFTRPSSCPYAPNSTELFSSFNTAPTVIYNNGTTYKIDQGINDSLVNLYVSTTDGPLQRFRVVRTNNNGVACVNISVNAPQLTCDFVANTSGDSNYANASVTRVVNFSEVSMSPGVSASQWDKDQFLKLTSSVGEGNASSSQVYVGTASPVAATVDLFGMPVYNAPVNITFAESNFTGIVKVTSNSSVSIPQAANFLHVVFNSTGLVGDISGYGVVNGRDLHLLAMYWLETVPPAPAYVDIGGKGSITGTDLHILTHYWLESVTSYYACFGAIADFGSEGNKSLDSAGCCAIPAGAKTFPYAIGRAGCD